MTVDYAVNLACQRFRELLEGATTGNVHAIPAGYFRRTDQSQRLVDQPPSIFNDRPYEVEWTEEGVPENGPANVSGNLIDVGATIMVRVGYLLGIGDTVQVQESAYEDARLIRRVLEHPSNYDADNTGITDVNRVRSRLIYGDDEDQKAILEMEFRLQLQEDQPTDG